MRSRFGFIPENMQREKTPVRALLAPAVENDGVAVLRLYDVIDSWGDIFGVSAREFGDALAAVPTDVGRIELHINSPGGDAFEGVAIMNQLRQHPAKVTAVVDGLAASAASFIAASADELVMGQNSQLFVHDAWGICMGSAADMASMGAMLDKASNNIAGIYAAKAGDAVGSWRAAMRAETWFTDVEAVDAGLADRVAEPAVDPAAAKDVWDLSVYAASRTPKAEPQPDDGADVAWRAAARARALRLLERTA